MMMTKVITLILSLAVIASAFWQPFDWISVGCLLFGGGSVVMTLLSLRSA